MCQGQRRDQKEKAESKRAHLQPSVIWTVKSLPTFTRKAAKGDLEMYMYKALLMHIVLAPGEPPKIPISWAPGLSACVLTHRIKPCVAPCTPAHSPPLTTAHFSTRLSGRTGCRISHIAALHPKQPHTSDPWRLLLEFPQQ